MCSTSCSASSSSPRRSSWPAPGIMREFGTRWFPGSSRCRHNFSRSFFAWFGKLHYMEATPPQEPIRKKETPPASPPEAVVRTSKRAAPPELVSEAEVDYEVAPPVVEIDS